jgi:hypothetical protein
MPSIGGHRRALIAVALAIGVCILFAALTSPIGHFEAAALLPVFLYSIVVLVTAHRRISHQPPWYVHGPLASDITFRGPPTS